jgi:signal transduction histidine kinase
MAERKALLEFLHRRTVPLAGVFAVLLAVVEILFDWGPWIDINVSIVYTLPLVLAAPARSRRLLWGLALVLVCMTFAVYYEQVAGVFVLREPLFIDRVLAALTVVLTAGVLDAWTRALDILDLQGQSLIEQNEQLDAANRDLLRNREEIARQNELLDRRRQEAEEASGRKSRFLASVSHDIRTPVNAINLMAEVVRRTAENPLLATQIPDLAQRLQANALSLADLLSEVLDISTFETGRIKVHESEFSLNELLAEECRRLLPLAQAKALQLAAEPPDPPLWLRTDRTKLARILTNLVSNAIKFTDAGAVTITAALTLNGALIHVRDTGVGMAPEHLERIFGEFAQLRDPDRDPNEGWGLGLAICRRLIGLIGGDITVESRSGHGSVFTVRLPVSSVADRSRGGADGAGSAKDGTGPA